MIPLRALAAAIPDSRIVGNPDTLVSDVFQDSRRVIPNSLFAIRAGQKSDGRAFVKDAVAKGAVAVLTEDAPLAEGSGLPALVVKDARRAIAFAASEAQGRPFDRLAVVGITGTNGKTTTTTLVGHVLEALGKKPAVLGTLGVRFEGELTAGAHTTPESDDIARTAADLVRRGATHLVMEVSSHALSLARVEAIPFAVAAFTNLTHDHLDFHGTFEAYGEAKARLFTDLAPRASVLDVDDAFGVLLAKRAKGRVLRVSAHGREGEIVAIRSSMSPDGLRATWRISDREVEMRSPLVGMHNLENLAVAMGIGVALGIAAEDVARALGSAPPVPGRLEKTSGDDDDVLVLVDYAHTPDALARAIAAVRPLTKGRVACVFGCGGDRDAAKRPRMGEAAAKGADELFVTNDNPRSEDPEKIAAAIVEGVRAAGREPRVILDRKVAIREAVLGAEPGDVVLVAGKGHEPYQIVGGVTRPFDDRDESRAALAERRESRWRR